MNGSKPSNNKQKLPNTVPNKPKNTVTSPASAAARKPPLKSMSSSATATANVRISTATSSLSFKAKLKQQIQDLKRAKRAKVQLKLDRERQQQIQIERQKKQEAMERERQLREQERVKREQERIEKHRLREQERLERQRQKEQEKLERVQLQEQMRLEKQLRKEQERERKEQERRQLLLQIEQERQRKLEWQRQQEEIRRRAYLQQVHQAQQFHHYQYQQGQQVQHQQPIPGVGLPQFHFSHPTGLPINSPALAGAAAVLSSNLTSPMVGRTSQPSASGQMVTPSPHQPPSQMVKNSIITGHPSSQFSPTVERIISRSEGGMPQSQDSAGSPTSHARSPDKSNEANVKSEQQTPVANPDGTSTTVSPSNAGTTISAESNEADSTKIQAKAEHPTGQAVTNQAIHTDEESANHLASTVDQDSMKCAPSTCTSNAVIESAEPIATASDSVAEPPEAKLTDCVETPESSNPNDAPLATSLHSCGLSVDKASNADKLSAHLTADGLTSSQHDLATSESMKSSTTFEANGGRIDAVTSDDFQTKKQTVAKPEGGIAALPVVDANLAAMAASSVSAVMPTAAIGEIKSASHGSATTATHSQGKGGVSISPAMLTPIHSMHSMPSSSNHSMLTQACVVPASNAAAFQLARNTGTNPPMPQTGHVHPLMYQSPQMMYPQWQPQFPHMAMNPIAAAHIAGSAYLQHHGMPSLFPQKNPYLPLPTVGVRQPQPAKLPISNARVATKPAAPSKKSSAPSFSAILDKLISAMEAPSPFLSTHKLLQEPIVIKRKSDEKFGVNVKHEQRSMLVETSWLEDHGYLPKSEKPEKVVTQPVTMQPELQEKQPVDAKAADSSLQVEPINIQALEGAKKEAELLTAKQTEQLQLQEKLCVKTDPVESQIPAPLSPTEPAGTQAEAGKQTAPMSVDKSPELLQDIPSVEKKPEGSTSEGEPMEIETNKESIAATPDLPEQLQGEPTTEPQVNSKAHSKPLEMQPAVGVTAAPVSIEKSGQIVEEGARNIVNLPPVAVPTAPKRPRRRRVFVGVMMVLDASNQNSRHEKPVLEEGDIILTIADHEVSGKKFSEAIGLFANVAASDDGVFRAPLIVARMKSKLSSEPTLSPSTNSQHASKLYGTNSSNMLQQKPQAQLELPSRPIVTTGAFVPFENLVLANCVVSNILDPNIGKPRLLGQSLSDESLQGATKSSVLANRMFPAIKDQLSTQARRFERILSVEASSSWKQAWLAETDDIRKRYDKVDRWSDADRSRRRNLPRPAKGCRCGKEDHEYVHDPKCGLYSNLVRLASPGSIEPFEYNIEKKVEGQFQTDKNLNVVETAYKDRLVKIKTASEMEEAEARFVAQMEQIQVQQCKQAVFAPSLATMVLSSVLELQSEFESFSRKKDKEATAPLSHNGIQNDESDDDDDDEEDLPLAALGKRNLEGQSMQDSKRQKIQNRLSFVYLVRLLSYCSKTWGHVYKEPSHSEYAW